MSTIYTITSSAFARIVPTSPGENRWQVHLSLNRNNVTCLAVDPTHAEQVYVGTRGSGLLKSGDGGETWHDTGLPQSDVFSVAVSQADRSLYAGCEPSRLWRQRAGTQIWEPLDQLLQVRSASTWSFPPRPWTSHVRSIAPNPVYPDAVLVGIEIGGVMMTRDGGESWFDHHPGAQRDVHALAWHPLFPDRAYQAGGGGAAWSRDGGLTWQPADTGRERSYTWTLALHPRDPSTWYVAASIGPGPAHGGMNAQASIYRWRGEGPWECISDSIASPLLAMPYSLNWCEEGLLAGMSDGQIWCSPDGDGSWQLLQLEGDGLGHIQTMVCTGATA